MFLMLFTKFKNFITNMVIAIAAFIVALLLAEWFVRIYMPSPDYNGGVRPAFYSNLFEYDETLGWRGVPNLSTPYFSKDFRIHLSHDTAGYRNISPPYQPEKNNFILLGDSYAWGWGVEDNQTATAVFNSRTDINNLYSLGIAGYGTDQEYLALQKFLATRTNEKYSGVIILFYMNDLDDISSNDRYGYPKPYYIQDDDGKLTLTNVPVPKKNVAQDIPVNLEPNQDDWLLKIQLFNFAGKSLATMLGKIFPPSDAHQIAGNAITEPERKNITLAANILGNIKEACLKRGMFFHVVFLMTKDTQNHNIELLQNLSEKLPAKDIEYSFFESRTFPRTDLWMDAHYTPYGQALLADHIADVIANKKLPTAQ